MEVLLLILLDGSKIDNYYKILIMKLGEAFDTLENVPPYKL